MADRIKVFGRSQNRIALGIVHGYCKMNPKITLAEVSNAFPKEVCPDAGVQKLFLPVDEAKSYNDKMNLYFTNPNEVVTLADGTVIAMAQVWSKSSLDKLIAQAAKYDIVASEPDKSVGGDGGFTIECLNGYSFPKAKKGCLGLIILPLIAAAGALACL